MIPFQDNIAGLGESSIDGLINSPERKDNRVDSTVLEAYSRHDNNVQESALSNVEPDKDADLSDDQEKTRKKYTLNICPSPIAIRAIRLKCIFRVTTVYGTVHYVMYVQ